jgi:hypothetical protein
MKQRKEVVYGLTARELVQETLAFLAFTGLIFLLYVVLSMLAVD